MDADAALAAGDRLSRLDDRALGHILSFLPATEAARAAALSHRWRHVFAAVHTLSFKETEPPFSMGYRWFKIRPHSPDNVRAPRFVIGVGAALIGRDRRAPRAASTAQLRALRVAFNEFGFLGGDARKAVDAWLSYAANHAGDTLEIELRLNREPVCGRKYTLMNGGGGGEQPPEPPVMADQHMELTSPPAAAEPNPRPNEYITPRSLFSCASLCNLHLDGCWLDLPLAIALPSLATVHLTRVTGCKSSTVQRLVAACPRLADLTLEACGGDLTELSVPGSTRLRRLALRCCHDLAAITVSDSSELRAFQYRGAVPAPRFLSMKHPPKIKLCTLDFCGKEPPAPPELGFLQLFAGVERLHITSARLGRGVIGHGVFSSVPEFPTFPVMRNLELTGMLPGDDTAAIAAVTRILERTPSLETLSLFFLPEPHPAATKMESYANDHTDEETFHAAHKLRYDRHATLTAPGFEIPCLRNHTREINFVHYQGAMAQRMLAKFLLWNAPVVDKVCCEFARGCSAAAFPCLAELRLRRCGVSVADLQRIVDAAPQLTTLHLERYSFGERTYGHSATTAAGPRKIYGGRLVCPAVTALVLIDCSWPLHEVRNKVEFDVPRLQYFRYKGSVRFAMERVFLMLPAASPGVVRPDLHFDKPQWRDAQTPEFIWTFVKSFNTAKVLKLKMDLTTDHLVAVAQKHEQVELILSNRLFYNLEHLEVEVPREPADETLALFIANFRCCPVLRDLHLKVTNNSPNRAGIGDYWSEFFQAIDDFRQHRKSPKILLNSDEDANFMVSDIPGLSDHSFDCLKSCLRTVSLQCWMEGPDCFEVQLAKFFAQNAMVLQEISIDDGNHKLREHMNRMLRRWLPGSSETKNSPTTTAFSLQSVLPYETPKRGLNIWLAMKNENSENTPFV
ncbi:unnamed protein product [Urochloa humidicola]